VSLRRPRDEPRAMAPAVSATSDLRRRLPSDERGQWITASRVKEPAADGSDRSVGARRATLSPDGVRMIGPSSPTLRSDPSAAGDRQMVRARPRPHDAHAHGRGTLLIGMGPMGQSASKGSRPFGPEWRTTRPHSWSVMRRGPNADASAASESISNVGVSTP